jgi:hypothetical protein
MKNLALALVATAALSAAAVSPALANYSYCTENPSAASCPGDYNIKDEPFAQPRHASEHHALRPKSASAKSEPSKASKSASAKNEPAKSIRSASHQVKQPTKQHG